MTRLWGVETRNRTLHIVVIDAQPSSVPLAIPGNNLRTAQLVQVRPRELIPNAPAALLESANSAWLLFSRAALREHGFGCAAGTPLQDAGRRAGYRVAAIWGTAAAAAVSVAYLAYAEIGTRESSGLASTAELVADHVNANAEHAEQTAPKTSLEPEQLRAVVQTRDRLLERSINAFGLMQRTAAALAPFPDLSIDLLEWSYGGAAADAVPPPADGTEAAADTIVLRVAGHSGASLLKSEANAAVIGFATALGHAFNGRQSIEKLPFDISPAGTLAGKPKGEGANNDNGGGNLGPGKIDFSLTVTVPVKRAS
jgi:hypothetical protein